LCQFQCNGALAASKPAGKKPHDIAREIIAVLGTHDSIEKLSVAGPGFINITVAGPFLATHLNGIAADPKLGCDATDGAGTVVIDYGGPNVAKPMHVGHLRSAIIGQCLNNLLTFFGHRVVSDNHLGDWGTQMGMLICAVEDISPDLPYFNSGFSGPYPSESPVTIDELERIYPEANGTCKSDPAAMARAQRATVELQNGRPGYVALWKHFVAVSVKRLTADFDKLGVTFDHWYGESFYQHRMETLVKKLRSSNAVRESDGALVMDVAQEGDSKEVPPLLLMKSDGAFLYGTSDLATLDFRMQTFSPSGIIYVVDLRQSLHFLQVFRAARTSGIVPEHTRLEHAGFGTVNGPDGRPFRTREGNAMQLGVLLDTMYEKAYARMIEAGVAAGCGDDEKHEIARSVGGAALRFADLQNHRTSDYVFDIDKFILFEGKTGPYLLYSAVRIKSILRNAESLNLNASEIIAPGNESERELMLVLGNFPDVLHSAAVNLAPNFICDWAYACAQAFNQFYRDCHVLKQKDRTRQSSWLGLIRLTLDELSCALNLLGIAIPDRM
jgi:arginyl-tRNA synthetase